MKKRTFQILNLLLIFSIIFMPLEIKALEFNPHFILTDRELTNSQAFTKEDIVWFLKKKGSGLINYFQTVYGRRKSASQIIEEAALKYKINPQYLITRIQVETSLITNSNPPAYLIDRAAGFACPDQGGCDPAYKGFYNQIMNAARIIRSYIDQILRRGFTISGWGPGIWKTTLDGIRVRPVNKATAALYTYTPWVGRYGGGASNVGGNSLFWKIWDEWFAQKYPEGTLLQVEGEMGVWLIQRGKRRPFWSWTALISRYNPSRIIKVSKDELEAYPIGTPLKYANYSILRDKSNGKIYLLVDDELRYITSPEVFRKIGFNPEEIIDIPSEEIESYPKGLSITLEDAYPLGILLQEQETFKVYYVIKNKKYYVPAPEILRANFGRYSLIRVSSQELAKYKNAGSLKFKNGTLVATKDPGYRSVFYISNGEKRPFASPEAMYKLGFDWGDVIWTSGSILDKYPEGKPIK